MHQNGVRFMFLSLRCPLDIQVEMLVGPDRYLSRSPQQGDDTEFIILNYDTMK